MGKRFIGVKELSEYLGLKVTTIYVWISLRKIPYIKLGRLVKFDLEEINEWMLKKHIKTIDSF